MSRLSCAAAFSVSAVACGGSFNAGPPAALPPDVIARDATSGKIKHVVIVIQENRSFNNLFYGYPGAKTVKYGYDSQGNKIELAPFGLEAKWDIEHDSYGYIAACNGTGSIPGTDCQMNGFNNEKLRCTDSCPPNAPYGYVPHSQTKPYFDIANQYVLADQMYASNFDASSFISHQYIIAGQGESGVDYPWTKWGCPGGKSDEIAKVGPQRQVPYGNNEVVCWDPTTLGDELDTAGVSWAFYTAKTKGASGLWSAYQAINHIYYGSDWKKDVITPQKRFFTDVRDGKLRAVNWVTPTLENSDHPDSGHKTGPAWIASIVNAIGQSKYWDSTAIIIFWDDYGGWYDSEPPAYVDYDGLGIRIPMLIVSAYAKKGHVSHVHYEHGSILRFVEDLFGLPRLAATDKRATSIAGDCFNFNKPPRKFNKIRSPLDVDFFMHQPTTGLPPDTN